MAPPRTGPSLGATQSSGRFATTSTMLSYLTQPVDMSTIPAEVVVAFKNLLKKDGTTKARALEDIIAYVHKHPYEDGGPDESILDAWVQIYPRTSIDNARRVRELSHTLQFALVSAARKRMERRIPSIIGAWLAGTFDRDKVVSRAACDGLAPFLTTDAKVAQFWTRCQPQILDYAVGAVKETPDTLSDERSTTREDAVVKFYRVVGSSLSLVLALLQKIEPAQLLTDRLDDAFLRLPVVWSLAAAQDPFVRKTVYQLLEACLDSRPDALKSHLPLVGRALVTDSVKSSQLGSATNLVKALTKLTRRYPEVWGTKKHPLDRLQPLLEKGSQGSLLFWHYLDKLFPVLPQQDSVSAQTAAATLKAMRKAISSREESRSDALVAWACYINEVERLLASAGAHTDFVYQNVFPLTRQYLFPSPELSSWASAPHVLLPKAWRIVARHANLDIRNSVEEEWQSLADRCLSTMANSLPEVSKDYKTSQQALAAEGDRWFDLTGLILGPDSKNTVENTDAPAVLGAIVTAASKKVVRGALELLPRRNYKTFGAAALVQSAFEKCPTVFATEEFVLSLLSPNKLDELSAMTASASAFHLVSCANVIAATDASLFARVWKPLVDATLARPDVSSPASIVALLISTPASHALAKQHSALQEFLLSACLSYMEGKEPPASRASRDFFEEVVSSGALGDGQIKLFIDAMLTTLGDRDTHNALEALECLLRKKPALIPKDQGFRLDLVGKLLSLTEISDRGVSGKACVLRSLLGQQASGDRPEVQIIQQNLESAGPRSLSIETLVQQAKAMCEANACPLEDLFPNSNAWMTELLPYLEEAPGHSLSLTSALGGAYTLVKPEKKAEQHPPRRDRGGISIPARMALYTSKLHSSGLALSALPGPFQVELLYLLFLTTEIADDQLKLMKPGGLWEFLSDHIAAEMEDFVESARRVLNDVVTQAHGWGDRTSGEGWQIEDIISVMLRQTQDFSPRALYSAKALGNLLQALAGTHGQPLDTEERLEKLGISRPTPANIFAIIAHVIGFGESLVDSKAISHLCNRAVSELNGASPGKADTLWNLILLNTCCTFVYKPGGVLVENRRLVIALKQMTQWTESPEEMGPGLAAEICKAVHHIFPSIRAVYGPYWEQAIRYCIWLWDHALQDPPETRLPYLHSSLKLVAALKSAPEDTNDDLTEALAENAKDLSAALINLLRIPHQADTQPSEIVESCLGRMSERIPLEHIEHVEPLFPLVASDSRAVQRTGFLLLHWTLPAVQEQLSVSVLLDKTDARLPDELMSILQDAPTLEKYQDDMLAQFPTSIRSYLLSWMLTFDAFGAAAQKLRSDYAENVKSGGYLGPLLDFMFDVLGHSAAAPLNLDKEGLASEERIRAYDPRLADATELPENNMHWLLCHLFFLVLKYLPGPFRAWYLECRSKPVKIALEGWMEKYFSPLMVADTLDEVASWAAAGGGKEEAQPADEERQGQGTELDIRVSKTTREVTVSYEVDGETGCMVVKLPRSFPLGQVEVAGPRRVAVSERRWEGWLQTTRAVVNLGGGAVTDGLAAFRRNVVGALRGQAECAICYSIVSSDRLMPDKHCGTCRNGFHRLCLYKWFQTSGQNTCPLCRCGIDYLGADTPKARRAGGAGY